MFNVRTAALSIIAAGAFLTLAQPAFAADPDAVETLSRLVSTEGLNLANAGDQRVLRHRIVAAAHHVCADLMVGGVSDGQGPVGLYQRGAGARVGCGAGEDRGGDEPHQACFQPAVILTVLIIATAAFPPP